MKIGEKVICIPSIDMGGSKVQIKGEIIDIIPEDTTAILHTPEIFIIRADYCGIKDIQIGKDFVTIDTQYYRDLKIKNLLNK